MKELKHIFIILIITMCCVVIGFILPKIHTNDTKDRFYKQNEVRINGVTEKLKYSVWIIDGVNNRVIEGYSINVNIATEQKIDSINAMADSMLYKINQLDKYGKSKQ